MKESEFSLSPETQDEPKEEEVRESVPEKAKEEEPARYEVLGNKFPEIFANSPLEKNSLVYSVPVMGEWKNGNLQRMLQAMFSQHIENTDPFEVEIIANVGNELSWQRREETEDGGFIVKINPEDERGGALMEYMSESEKSVAFLKQIVEIQRLARMAKLNPEDAETSAKLKEKIESENDPLLRSIVESAAKKSEGISLAVVDATHTVFQETEYRNSTSVWGLRTLGADIASARFENPNVVLGMFDADTVLEGNNSVKSVQKIFQQQPGLNYLFTGMANLPAGTAEKLVATAPKENIRRTLSYNESDFQGSPQIFFKLESYKKLQEIAGSRGIGFNGHEDFDTARKLIYHFGELQDGLLFETTVYAPTSLTGDRIDGSMDSMVRAKDFRSENGVVNLPTDLGRMFGFREKIEKLVGGETPSKKEKILKDLEKSRKNFLKKERVQQKFNRAVLGTFLRAEKSGLISLADGELALDENKILKLRGGKALLHYVKSNNKLIGEVLNSPDDMQVIECYLDKEKNLPEHELTPFQLAVREYMGEVAPLNTLVDKHVIEAGKAKKDKDYEEWDVADLRKKDSGVSIMHSFVAETLALAHIYRTYFETSELLPSEEDYAKDTHSAWSWPKDRSKKEMDIRFGDPEARKELAKEKLDEATIDVPKKIRSGFFNFDSVPIFKLFKRFLKK